MSNSNLMCPGGRNKLIKDCCPDLVKPLEDIAAMLKSEQYGAVKAQLDFLEKKHTDCLCLKYYKVKLLRLQEQYSEALALIQPLSENDPENMELKVEFGLALLYNNKIQEAYSCLIEAIELQESGNFLISTGELYFTIIDALFAQRFFLPGTALLNTFIQLTERDEKGFYDSVIRPLSNPAIPTFLKGLDYKQQTPDNYPFDEEYLLACRYGKLLQLKKSLAKFEELAEKPDVPACIYWNIAVVSAWLLDNDKATAALEKFLAMPGLDPDDATDAIFFKEYINVNPVDKTIRIRNLTYTIYNAQDALENLLSEQSLKFPHIDPSMLQPLEDGTPPPQKIFFILNKPKQSALMATDAVDSNEIPPYVLAEALFFGKQTDREARLQIAEVAETNITDIENRLRTILGASFGQLEENIDVGEIPETIYRLIVNFPFDSMQEKSEKELPALMNYLKKDFVPWWQKHPYTILDNKTPEDVITDPSLRPALEAFFMTLKIQLADQNFFSQLEKIMREALKLDSLPIIQPNLKPDENEEDVLASLIPLWRWDRVDFSALSTNYLIQAYNFATLYGINNVLETILNIALDRPEILNQPELCEVFLAHLINLALAEKDLQKTQKALEKAYQFALDTQRSDGHWNLQELILCLNIGNMKRFQQLSEHLHNQHSAEEDVMQQFAQIMNYCLQRMNAMQSQQVPGNAMAPSNEPMTPPASQEKTGLWTPDSDSPNNSSDNGGSKLWVPGS